MDLIGAPGNAQKTQRLLRGLREDSRRKGHWKSLVHTACMSTCRPPALGMGARTHFATEGCRAVGETRMPHVPRATTA